MYNNEAERWSREINIITHSSYLDRIKSRDAAQTERAAGTIEWLDDDSLRTKWNEARNQSLYLFGFVIGPMYRHQTVAIIEFHRVH